MEEQTLVGWKAIAEVFKKTSRTVIKKRIELKESGVIFYTDMGRPPRQQVCCFPSILKAWITMKTLKGEKI